MEKFEKKVLEKKFKLELLNFYVKDSFLKSSKVQIRTFFLNFFLSQFFLKSKNSRKKVLEKVQIRTFELLCKGFLLKKFKSSN